MMLKAYGQTVSHHITGGATDDGAPSTPYSVADLMSLAVDVAAQSGVLENRLNGVLTTLCGPRPTAVPALDQNRPEGLVPALAAVLHDALNRINHAHDVVADIERTLGS